VITIPIDEFESTRPPRRLSYAMVIPSFARVAMLKAAGHSEQEIKHAEKKVQAVKSQRQDSFAIGESFEEISLGIETVKAFFRKRRRKRAKDESLMLSQ